MRNLGLLACVLLVGCVQKTDKSLSAAEAKSAGDALSTSVETSAALFGPMDQSATADATCVTLSGDTTDPDGDNIPVDAKLTYACSQTLFGLTGMVTGTISLTDDNPAAAAWAFTGTANLHASLTAANSQASIISDRDGQLVATQAGLLGPFSLAHDVAVTTIFTGDRGATATVGESGNWTLTFTPQVSWTPGGVIVTGSLAATGNWNVSVGSKDAAATLATPTPLTLTPSCETRVTAGSLAATYDDSDGNAHAVTVTWTGCGQRTVTSS